MPQLRLLDQPVDRIEAEVAAALFFLDERPLCGPQALLDWRLNGRLTGLLQHGSVSGCAGEHLLVRSNGKVAADWVLFVGGGRRRGLGEWDCRELLSHLLATCRRAGFSRIALGLGLLAGMKAFGLQTMVRETLDQMAPGNLECLLSIADDTARLV